MLYNHCCDFLSSCLFNLVHCASINQTHNDAQPIYYTILLYKCKKKKLRKKYSKFEKFAIMLLVFVLMTMLLLSETEPYWDFHSNTVTKYNPWFLINCKCRIITFSVIFEVRKIYNYN